METMAVWLPRCGALIMVLFGVIGFLSPRLFLDRLHIRLESPDAVAEARAVFGGINLGLALAALYFDHAVLFTALGIAWAVATLARLWSLLVDNIGLKASLPGLVVDVVLALLFFSPLLLLR